MINIFNEENFALIMPYINQEKAYEMIKAETDLVSALSKLNVDDADRAFKNNLYQPRSFQAFMKGRNILPDVGQYLNNEIIHVLTNKLTFTTPKSQQIKIDSAKAAKFIRKLFKLSYIPETKSVMMYNYALGFWNTDTLVLERFIYEMVQSTLGIKWSSNLQDLILKEVDKKLPIVSQADLNTKGFPFKNATLDYKTNEITSHSPSFFSTISSEVMYDPDASCPIFMNALDKWFTDANTKLFVQEWFGYCLSGSFKSNAFLLVYSSGGEGKSTFFDILSKLVTPINCSAASLSNLNSEFGLEPIVGKKVNISTESGSSAFNTSKLKAITAGEKITVNRKNRSEVDMILTAKLIFLLNELPQLTDRSVGFSRRLLILPFLNTIPIEKQDKNLPQKLNDELSGILNWALEGLKRLHKNQYKFTISAEMKKMHNAYLGKKDIMTYFVECRLDVDESMTHRIRAKDMINTFKIWGLSKNINITQLSSPKVFWREFDRVLSSKNMHYSKDKSGGTGVIKGLKYK
ncbi:phage/plasmid primase, P4 family [Macrococcoides canis]|uniref:DNA primase family protein n=1 Tax=Macrococcoides canis TaxID=1855823 RepID=UPI001F3397B8|nr:phage/plasmid primase, P4 family [Macrococcus canis]UJS27823.1 phage/plasmid primase, P4 family [Macrococcus canis]